MRVLIADDAMFMRTVLKNILVKAGHQVVAEASNGVEMLSKYEEVNPDIVTLDITMPEMDGLEAVKQLIIKHPDARVIMCSAMGQKAMVIEAIRNGAKDFIVKPFKPELVLETLERCSK